MALEKSGFSRYPLDKFKIDTDTHCRKPIILPIIAIHLQE